MKGFIRALLSSQRTNWRLRAKDWGRAYLNLGILRYIQGNFRTLPCGAATDTFFVSPFGEILACNGSAEPWVMGDLKSQAFEELWRSPQSEAVRQQVRDCRRNCWMTGTAVPAMRKNPLVPLTWVVKNKIRQVLGKEIIFSP